MAAIVIGTLATNSVSNNTDNGGRPGDGAVRQKKNTVGRKRTASLLVKALRAANVRALSQNCDVASVFAYFLLFSPLIRDAGPDVSDCGSRSVKLNAQGGVICPLISSQLAFSGDAPRGDARDQLWQEGSAGRARTCLLYYKFC